MKATQSAPGRSTLILNFSLEDIADFICEFTQDGKNPQGRDVCVKWFSLVSSGSAECANPTFFGGRKMKKITGIFVRFMLTQW